MRTWSPDNNTSINSLIFYDLSFFSVFSSRIHVKPTNAPPWSKDPVPIKLIGNSPGAPHDSIIVPFAKFLLKHEAYLPPQGAFDILMHNVSVAQKQASLAVIGQKLFDEKPPEKFRSPRILWSQLSTPLNANQRATFNVDDLRNHGDLTMTVHKIVVHAYDPAGDHALFDDFAIRIRSGNVSWTGQNRFVSIGALRMFGSSEIHVPNIEIGAHESIIAEIENRSGLTLDPVQIAIIGTVEVNAA